MVIDSRPTQEDSFLQRLRTWLVLGNGVIATVLLGLVVQWQAGILQSEQADARRHVQGVALSISQTIEGQMDQVDLDLQSVALQLQAMEKNATPLRAAQVNSVLAAQLGIMPLLDGLTVTDALGRVRYSDHLDPAQTLDLRDSAHFQQARAQTRAALIISEALVSPVNQSPMLFAVRRLEHADGSFAGIVSAKIRQARFQRIFSSVDLGDQGAVSLRNEARQILALVFAGKSQDSFFGNSETSPELARAFDSQAPSGSFVSTVKQDGVERISAFQRVGNYPLMVILGEGTSSFILPWREQVERIALLCMLGAATMAVLSVLVYFAIRRETGGRSKLETALQRSQAWMQASQDGVHVLDGSGTIVRASASLSAMLGYHTDYLQGHNLSLLTALPLQALMPTEPATLRKLCTQYRRLDGSLLDVELYVSRLVDSTGALLYCSARDISPFLNTPQEEP